MLLNSTREVPTFQEMVPPQALVFNMCKDTQVGEHHQESPAARGSSSWTAG